MIGARRADVRRDGPESPGRPRQSKRYVVRRVRLTPVVGPRQVVREALAAEVIRERIDPGDLQEAAVGEVPPPTREADSKVQPFDRAKLVSDRPGNATWRHPAVAERVPAGVLYASGEESIQQVRLRAGRLGLTEGAPGSRIRLLAESEVEAIAERARDERPELLIVDSIQTLITSELDGPAGTVGQVRGAAARLIGLAKSDGISVILVGHVTKDGTLAGPKTLEHLVDVVLAIEGERSGGLRLLRAQKNRFGSTEEIGVFEMGERGLSEVADPGRAFLGERDGPAPGSVVAPTLEGSRPILVEVQALVAPTSYPSPRRTASGLDSNRLALLVAVLGRRAGIGLGAHDVYANLAGGLALSDPGLDLPVGLALASSLRDRAISPTTVAIGEVGLLGELRPVGGLERRLREAARLGFARAIVPRSTRGSTTADGIEVVPASTIVDAIEHALEPPAPRRGGRVAAPGRC